MDASNEERSDEAKEPETDVEKYLRFSRNCRHFIDYINYDWESDKAWIQFQKDNM